MPEPTTTPEKPPAKTLPESDPFMARTLQDMGLAMKDGNLEPIAPAPEAPAPTATVQTFTTLGELAKAHADKKAETDGAKKTEDPPKQEPGKKEEEGAPKEQSKEEPKKEEPKQEEPKVEDPPKKKIEVERPRPIEEIVEGAVKRAIEEGRVPKPEDAAKKEDPAPDPDAEYVNNLDEERRYVIDVIQFAAKDDPKKYGDAPKQWLGYYKKVDDYVQRMQKEDPEWDADKDEKFQSFVEENSPKISTREMRQIERNWAVAEAEKRVEKRYAPKLEEAERRVRAQELKPEIDAAAENYRSMVYDRMATVKDPELAAVATTAKTGGYSKDAWGKAAEQDKLGATFIQHYGNQAVELGREYLELSTGVRDQVQFNPKLAPDHPQNLSAQRQAALFKFIERQETAVARAPVADRLRDGKTFATRREFESMTPQQKERHWTLTHDDVLDSLAITAQMMAESAFKTEIQKLQDAGFERKPKKQETKKEEKPAADPPKVESPKATTTPSPGAGKSAPPVGAQTIMSATELEHMHSTGEKRWVG